MGFRDRLNAVFGTTVTVYTPDTIIEGGEEFYVARVERVISGVAQASELIKLGRCGANASKRKLAETNDQLAELQRKVEGARQAYMKGKLSRDVMDDVVVAAEQAMGRIAKTLELGKDEWPDS